MDNGQVRIKRTNLAGTRPFNPLLSVVISPPRVGATLVVARTGHARGVPLPTDRSQTKRADTQVCPYCSLPTVHCHYPNAINNSPTTIVAAAMTRTAPSFSFNNSQPKIAPITTLDARTEPT